MRVIEAGKSLIKVTVLGDPLIGFSFITPRRTKVFHGDRIALAKFLQKIQAKDDETSPRSERGVTYQAMADEIIDGTDTTIWVWSTMMDLLNENNKNNKLGFKESNNRSKIMRSSRKLREGREEYFVCRDPLDKNTYYCGTISKIRRDREADNAGLEQYDFYQYSIRKGFLQLEDNDSIYVEVLGRNQGINMYFEYEGVDSNGNPVGGSGSPFLSVNEDTIVAISPQEAMRDYLISRGLLEENISRRNEGVISDDDNKIKALIDYLGYEVNTSLEVEEDSDDSLYGEGDIFETPQGDYAVLTNDEADRAFSVKFLSLWDEKGYSMFKEDFQNWILDNCLNDEELFNQVLFDLSIKIYDDPAKYIEFLDAETLQAMKAEIKNLVSIYSENQEEIQDRILDYETFFLTNPDKVEQEYIDAVILEVDKLEDVDLFTLAKENEIGFLYSDNMAENCVNSIGGVVEFIKANYLGDDFINLVEPFVDVEKLLLEVKAKDGRGSLLSEDKEEVAHSYDGDTFYIYKNSGEDIVDTYIEPIMETPIEYEPEYIDEPTFSQNDYDYEPQYESKRRRVKEATMAPLKDYISEKRYPNLTELLFIAYMRLNKHYIGSWRKLFGDDDRLSSLVVTDLRKLEDAAIEILDSPELSQDWREAKKYKKWLKVFYQTSYKRYIDEFEEILRITLGDQESDEEDF
jgi:hypothetical protein